LNFFAQPFVQDVGNAAIHPKPASMKTQKLKTKKLFEGPL
jgi:hypothetical protein